MRDGIVAHRVLVAICLGLLASAAAALPAFGRPFAAPLVDLEVLVVGARLGYSAGEQVLPGFHYRLGGYGDGWLRAYGPGAFSGPILLNGTVEYRRPWLEALPVPVLSQLEGGPFLDAGTTASHGTAWAQLEWHSSYGLTAALPLSGILLGMDLAWNEQAHFRAGLRASGEF